MISIIRQIILETKNLLGGASSSAVNSLVPLFPSWVDTSFLTSETSILGLSIPTFLIYLVFFGE